MLSLGTSWMMIKASSPEYWSVQAVRILEATLLIKEPWLLVTTMTLTLPQQSSPSPKQHCLLLLIHRPKSMEKPIPCSHMLSLGTSWVMIKVSSLEYWSVQAVRVLESIPSTKEPWLLVTTTTLTSPQQSSPSPKQHYWLLPIHRPKSMEKPILH